MYVCLQLNMCFVLGPIFSVLSSACGTQPHRKLSRFFRQEELALSM